MRIICAPDSFKGTCRAIDASHAMAKGAVRVDQKFDCVECPIGDGGEGTMDAIASDQHAVFHTREVVGPLGKMTTARFGVCAEGVAIVELAEAAGLSLLPVAHRNPMMATTFGVGQLIQHAIDLQCREITICIGGSATIDGGTGLAQALGARFFDRSGKVIESHMCGGLLQHITRWEPPQLPRDLVLRVACDVTNPLYGPDGAASVYGPQKGATPVQVQELDESLAHLAKIVGGDPFTEGAGAAGGTGFGLMAMRGATLERGVDLVLDAVRFDDRCRNADLVITGEGRLDSQSLHGKACIGVAERAAKHGLATVAVVGMTGEGAAKCFQSHGAPLQDAISLTDLFGEGQAMNDTQKCIEDATVQLLLRMR